MFGARIRSLHREANPPFDRTSIAAMYRHINEVLLGDEAAADRSTAAPVDASEAAPPGMMALNSVEPLLFIVVAPRSVDFKSDQSFSPRFILGKVSQSAGRSVCHERTAAASLWICFQAAGHFGAFWSSARRKRGRLTR